MEKWGTKTMSETAGVIGLGIMGSAFARNLAAAGWDVIGYDIDAGQIDALAGTGVRFETSPVSVAEAAGVVVTSLPSPAAFHGVMSGPGGIIECGRDGLIVIDTCTLSLEDKQAGFDALAEKSITLLDCPVSGTGAQAADGDLAILASGEEGAYQKALPVLRPWVLSARLCCRPNPGNRLNNIAAKIERICLPAAHKWKNGGPRP